MRVIAIIAAATGTAIAACSDHNESENVSVVRIENRVTSIKARTVAKFQHSASAAPIKPVRIGFSPELDACPISSKVSGLNPKGDNYLSVRASPHADSREIDRLGPDTEVDECDYDGDFVGIVYPAPGQDYALCGTGGAVPTVRDYHGPCRSGWVSKKYLTQVAG